MATADKEKDEPRARRLTKAIIRRSDFGGGVTRGVAADRSRGGGGGRRVGSVNRNRGSEGVRRDP